LGRVVNTEDYVFGKLWTAIRSLDASHPLFGPSEPKKRQLPLVTTGKGNTSWERKLRAFAKQVARYTGPRMIQGSCWLVKGDKFLFNHKTASDKTAKSTAAFSLVRLLAFLATPSDESWRFVRIPHF
jgi:hypothetical protein